MTYIIKQISNSDEIKGVIKLQTQYLKKNLTTEEVNTFGYLTFESDEKLLTEINLKTPTVVAKLEEEVVGYCITLDYQYRKMLPLFYKMYEAIEDKYFEAFLINCQACVSDKHKGNGILKSIYNQVYSQNKGKYEIMFGEIAQKNTRSQNAHRNKVKYFTSYQDDIDFWDIYCWEILSQLKNTQ